MDIFRKQLASRLQTIILSANPARTALSEFDPSLDCRRGARTDLVLVFTTLEGEKSRCCNGMLKTLRICMGLLLIYPKRLLIFHSKAVGEVVGRFNF